MNLSHQVEGQLMESCRNYNNKHVTHFIPFDSLKWFPVPPIPFHSFSCKHHEDAKRPDCNCHRQTVAYRSFHVSILSNWESPSTYVELWSNATQHDILFITMCVKWVLCWKLKQRIDRFTEFVLHLTRTGIVFNSINNNGMHHNFVALWWMDGWCVVGWWVGNWRGLNNIVINACKISFLNCFIFFVWFIVFAPLVRLKS